MTRSEAIELLNLAAHSANEDAARIRDYVLTCEADPRFAIEWCRDCEPQEVIAFFWAWYEGSTLSEIWYDD